jgi:predicted RNA-binding protein with PUA-like domain
MADPVLYIVSIVPVPLMDRGEAKRNGTSTRKPHPNHEGLRNACCSSPAPGTRNAWLFQSNPALYDLRGALRVLKEQVWSVSRYAKHMLAGDRVYLWEAGSGGGIAGVAEICEAARVQPEPAEQIPFARMPDAFAGERPRARLKILRILEPVIPRAAVAANPELSRLGVLRCPRGTNFPLNVDQWRALNSLIVAE